MKTEIEHPPPVTWYVSEIDPSIRTSDARMGAVIAAADKCPVVWEIVRGKKSKLWGASSYHYLGYLRGNNSAAAIIGRAEVMLDHAESTCAGPPGSDIFAFAARFAIEHYRDKNYKSGAFVQHDDKYPRGTMTLDYTPDTRDEVVDRFLKWCGNTFVTREVRLDGKVVRRFTSTEVFAPGTVKTATLDIAADDTFTVTVGKREQATTIERRTPRKAKRREEG